MSVRFLIHFPNAWTNAHVRLPKKSPLHLEHMSLYHTSLRYCARYRKLKAESGLKWTQTSTVCSSIDNPNFFSVTHHPIRIYSFLQDPAKPIKASAISDACKVVDVLGPDVRTQIIERYVALEFKEYRRIFRTTDEAGQLDNISRRFAWFRRELQAHETETGRVFPGDWRVGWYLLAKFIETTRSVRSPVSPRCSYMLVQR